MKDWFPLASYEFYAFLTAGMVALAAYDRVFMGSALAHEQHWTIVSGVFWTVVAYLVGQIIAMPSAALLEHVVARRILRPPSDIVLGIHPPRRRERWLAALSGAREYQPFPVLNQTRIMGKLATGLNVASTAMDGEAAFVAAFPHARGVADTATRLDNFINQYGMCRNVSMAAIIATAMLAYASWQTHDRMTVTLMIGAAVLAIGLFLRFIKFYAAYTREVFRTYDKVVS